MEFKVIKIEKPDDMNIIIGQSHFIKTVEDLYEALATSVPGIKFGFAFTEASGPCLVRKDGNDEELVDLAVKNALAVGAGHTFYILLRNAYPINVMDAIKKVSCVVSLYCATANPVEVIVAETEQGRGIIGVVDGFSPKGVETEEDIEKRKSFLRTIGYKR